MGERPVNGRVVSADPEDGLWWLWKRRVLCGFSYDLVGAFLASTGRAASTGLLALAQTRPGKVAIRITPPRHLKGDRIFRPSTWLIA